MFKKIFSVCALAFALVFAAIPNSQAEASDYYVGTYSDGTNAFLVTESVRIYSRYPYSFSCYVKYAHTGLSYQFYPLDGSPYYRNSEGYHGYVFDGNSPVAENIYRLVVRNW